ncbi:N amino acid transport system protein [Colletotrichum higginsianum]|uniref:N amino acid transport system protein n=1 Tax=Colletotrichum higginsianum (strain IMI 349063) TaxID=759273 RepID=H1VRC1_COLHI|nr:N amino acid transport system protein [Colletotrichum higginsianum]
MTDHISNTPSFGRNKGSKGKDGSDAENSQPPNPWPVNDNTMLGETSDELNDARLKQIAAQGSAHFHRLGWKRLAIVTIVEAVALGALSLPSAYHTLGMFPGVFLTITIGMLSIFTSYLVGRVKLAHPHVANYAEAGRLLFGRYGRIGYEIFGAALVLELVMVVGSHALTGSIALLDINGGHVCSIVFSAVSAIILLILAIPPSFTESRRRKPVTSAAFKDMPGRRQRRRKKVN